MKDVILHIGLHRTGTSSFQTAMVAQEQAFRAAGIAPYPGQSGSGHARELAFACLRPGVFDTGLDGPQIAALRTDLARFIDTAPEPRILISSEHLSLIRNQEEIDRLRALFEEFEIRLQILAVRREPEEWFRSYTDQIVKEKAPLPAPVASRRNVAPDSWVKDFEPMLDLYARNFPQMTVLDYEAGDMVGVLMAALSVTPGFNTRAYQRNGRSLRARFGPLGYKFVHAILGSEHHGLIHKLMRAREAYLLRK